MYYIQYFYYAYLAHKNRPNSIRKQTEGFLISSREKVTKNSLLKQKRQAQTLILKPAKKRVFIDQSLPPLIFARNSGRQTFILISLTTRSKLNKSLIEYPNIAGVAIELQSLHTQKKSSKIYNTFHQHILMQINIKIKTEV